MYCYNYSNSSLLYNNFIFTLCFTEFSVLFNQLFSHCKLASICEKQTARSDENKSRNTSMANPILDAFPFEFPFQRGPSPVLVSPEPPLHSRLLSPAGLNESGLHRESMRNDYFHIRVRTIISRRFHVCEPAPRRVHVCTSESIATREIRSRDRLRKCRKRRCIHLLHGAALRGQRFSA